MPTMGFPGGYVHVRKALIPHLLHLSIYLFPWPNPWLHDSNEDVGVHNQWHPRQFYRNISILLTSQVQRGTINTFQIPFASPCLIRTLVSCGRWRSFALLQHPVSKSVSTSLISALPICPGIPDLTTLWSFIPFFEVWTSGRNVHTVQAVLTCLTALLKSAITSIQARENRCTHGIPASVFILVMGSTLVAPYLRNTRRILPLSWIIRRLPTSEQRRNWTSSLNSLSLLTVN